MGPRPFFSPEDDPDTVGYFGGYRSPTPPSPAQQDDPPADLAAADGEDPEQLAAARIAPDGLTPEQRRTQYESLLQHPNVRAFLNTIAQTEGATYDTLPDLPGKPKKFSDYSRFPLEGSGGTASGRYQILRPTYDYASRALGVSDFSPHTQDLMAVYLLDHRGALEPLLRGDLNAVLPGASREWASLPKGPGLGNRYPGQPFMASNDVSSIFDLNRSP